MVDKLLKIDREKFFKTFFFILLCSIPNDN